ncbi:MAG: hypothetical protein C5B49_10510 [Bdellovibrio sp.]|nr:MAG: hypothetical protein C5B49_10510 [Bdellovibrio sp.]
MRKNHPGIPLGIIGQSEGCLVALKAYDLGSRPEFILLQSPALLPFDQILDHQKTRAAKPFLNDKTGELTRKYPYVSAFYQAMYNGDMLKRIRETREPYYEFKNGKWSATTSLEKYREYMWDGLEFLKKVEIPVVIFFGLEDLNVIPTVANRIRAEQAAGGYPNVSIREFEGLEHSFRELRKGEAFFDALAKPLSPRYTAALKEVVMDLTDGRSSHG